MKKYLFLLFISLVSCVFALQLSELKVYADNKASIVTIGDLNENAEQEVSHEKISTNKEEKTKLKSKKELPETGGDNMFSLFTMISGIALLMIGVIISIVRIKKKYGNKTSS